MENFLGAIPQLFSIVEKGGVVGVLTIVCVVLGYEVRRLRLLAPAIYKQRDRWRLAYTIVKAAADGAGAKYDLRDLEDMLKEDGSPA